MLFDEPAYRKEHPDVDEVVRRGVLESGLEHYQRFGKWEGRRYPTRRDWRVPLVRFLLWAEALLRAFWDRANPFALTSRLVAQGVYPWRALVGPDGMKNFHGGPWRAALHPWQRGRFVLVEMAVDCRAEATLWTTHPLGDAGEHLGPGQILECRPTGVSKRVLRLPAGTRSLEWRQAGDGAAWIGALKVKPLSLAAAGRIIQRRLARPESGIVPEEVSRALASSHENEPTEMVWRAYENTFPCTGRPAYDRWLQRVYEPRCVTIVREASERVAALSPPPQFSVLVPVFNPNVEHLRACLDSLLAQSYPHWEACVVDDASTDQAVRRVLSDYAKQDERILLRFRKTNGHISRTSQDALEMARGEFVALLDHDDLLAPQALMLMADTLGKNPEAVLVYSDEDKLDEAGNPCEPHFKPDFDLDRLLGHNYMAHLLVARRELTIERGGFRTGFEGSQDHDLVLRLVAGQRRDHIVHLPEILYHWRKHPRSTAASGESKPYTLEAGRRAVLSFLADQRLDAKVELDTEAQCLRLRWPLPTSAPRVSIIVPTRDGLPLLARCVRSILDRTAYPNFEVLIVDNQSSDERTLRYLERAAEDERVAVLRHEGPFNFSAINNVAACKATGSILAFVNDDVEALQDDWLLEMVSHALRPDVGCVGCMLLYPDGSIQHAGVLLGIGGVAGHAFKTSGGHVFGYFSKLRMAHTVSAVTAACMLIQRRIFEKVGGFDEEQLAVAFNDVDLCLRVQGAGYRNVLTPHAVLRQVKSASRGSDEGESKRERFAKETGVMRERWADLLANDPYYSPHLTREFEDYTLRTRYERDDEASDDR